MERLLLSQARSPTTFRLIQIRLMQMMAGLEWAIGSGLAQLPTHLRQYRSFKKARAFVRGLGLKSEAEWRDYCKSGKKPDDIPANPHRHICRSGWAG